MARRALAYPQAQTRVGPVRRIETTTGTERHRLERGVVDAADLDPDLATDERWGSSGQSMQPPAPAQAANPACPLRPTLSAHPARAGNGAFCAVDTGLHVLAIEHTRRDELMVTTFNSTP